MSYSSAARTVRDTTRPPAEREAALARCVTWFAPFGLTRTRNHLHRASVGDDPSARLTAAIDLLDEARAAWTAEVARFAEQRRVLKRRGHRRVTAAEVDRYATYGWPGGPAGGPLDGRFLRRYGIAVWEPAPVDLRRRARRATRDLPVPTRFDADPLGLVAVIVVLVGSFAPVVWLFGDLPSTVWLIGVVAASAAVCWAVARGVRNAARYDADRRTDAEVRARRRELLTSRLQRAEQERDRTGDRRSRPQ